MTVIQFQSPEYEQNEQEQTP